MLSASTQLNFQKLRALHEVASKHNDADMTNFIEEKLLQEQAETVKKVSELVSQLRRIGKVWVSRRLRWVAAPMHTGACCVAL